MSGLKEKDIVVLCGGLGKRLRSQIGESQKVMAAIDEEPFLNILLEYARQQGFRRLIMCTGYKAQNVEEYYRQKSFDLDIIFSREDEPLGTGGAIKKAKQHIQSDLFFILNGDSFCPLDYSELLKFHQDKQSCVTVAISTLAQRKDFGSITIDDAGQITSFKEKESSEAGYVNAGVYCFNQDVFSMMPNEEKFSLEMDLFPSLQGKGLFGFKTEKEFFDIGTPERFKKAKQFLGKVG